MSKESEALDWSGISTPHDDGATRHLVGASVAPVSLPASDGESIDLSTLVGRSIVYAYPLTRKPGVEQPDGCDLIPGAKGCTPQACSFRDHFSELRELGVDHVFGLSTQSSAYQREAAERLHLPFPILSDAHLELAGAMNLPTFDVDDMTLMKRFTLVIENGVVVHVFYPVFPPDRNARDVVDWLESRSDQ